MLSLAQPVNIKDQLQFWPLNGKTASEYTDGKFVQVYGDSFISGFQEGGVFSAVVSIKSLETSNKLNIAANAHLALSVGVGELKADADIKIAKDTLAKQSEVTITVNWSGGGQIKNSNKLWTIDTMQEAAAAFADRVAACPQRTHAILTKYDSLRTYLSWKGKDEVSLLGYETATLYVSELLDAYMGYKSIWSDIHKKMQDLDAGTIELVEGPSPTTPVCYPRVPKTETDLSKSNIKEWKDGPEIKKFPATFAGLDLALQTCRSLMIRIVNENDYISKNPQLATDKDRPVAYLRPQVFRQLLPVPPPAPTLTVKLYTLDERIQENEAKTFSYARQSVIPTVIGGFSHLDLSRVTELRIGAKVGVTDLKLDAASISRTQPGLPYPTQLSCIAIPANNDGLLGGVCDLKGGGTAKVTIKFDYPYDTAPRVIVWLQAFDIGISGFINLSAKTGSVRTDSFEVMVRGDAGWASATVGWMAMPQDLGGIVCGSTETSWAPGLTEKQPTKDDPVVPRVQGLVQFLPKTFTKPSKVIAFINGFAFTDKRINFRIRCLTTSATKRGFSWSIESLLDTEMIGASISWLAFREV